jgi:hypothetical protein
LKITTRQKAALIGVFAFGIFVAVLDVARGAYVLATPTTQQSLGALVILITVQGNLGVVAANLPILRPLFFNRSFGSHSSIPHHSGSNISGRPWAKRQQLIPLGEYDGSHAVVSGGASTEHILEAGSIVKTVEARVEFKSTVNSGNQFSS